MPTKPDAPINFGSGFGARQSKYPWDDLLNGEQWICRKGEDYEVSDQRFRLAANSAARKRNLTTKTKIVEPGVLALQAFPKPDASTTPDAPDAPDAPEQPRGRRRRAT